MEKQQENIQSEKELEKMLYANQKLKEDIIYYTKMIEESKKLIHNNEKLIWKKCNHTWKRDYDVAFDDHIKYYCSKCGLWNNDYMYN